MPLTWKNLNLNLTEKWRPFWKFHENFMKGQKYMVCEAKGMSHLSWYLFTTNSHLISKYNLFFPLAMKSSMILGPICTFMFAGVSVYPAHSTFAPPIFQWYFFPLTRKNMIGRLISCSHSVPLMHLLSYIHRQRISLVLLPSSVGALFAQEE